MARIKSSKHAERFTEIYILVQQRLKSRSCQNKIPNNNNLIYHNDKTPEKDRFRKRSAPNAAGVSPGEREELEFPASGQNHQDTNRKTR